MSILQDEAPSEQTTLDAKVVEAIVAKLADGRLHQRGTVETVIGTFIPKDELERTAKKRNGNGTPHGLAHAKYLLSIRWLNRLLKDGALPVKVSGSLIEKLPAGAVAELQGNECPRGGDHERDDEGTCLKCLDPAPMASDKPEAITLTVRHVERIGAYEVHPAASIFPLLEGEDFEALCDSIKKFGLLHPMVTYKGKLLDGRNRLRAILKLNEQGYPDAKAVVVEWQPGRCETPAEYIYDTNRERRHLSDDAIAIVSCEILPLIAAERAEIQAGTQFKPGNQAAKKTTDTKSCPPSAPRTAKEKHANSTVGKIAAAAGVSMHKARQALAVKKAVAAGEVSQDDVRAVMDGKKKLRDIAPRPEKSEPHDTINLDAEQNDEVANRLAAEYGVSPEQILLDARFSKAIDQLRLSCRHAADKILAGKTKLSAAEVIGIAAMPSGKQTKVLQKHGIWSAWERLVQMRKHVQAMAQVWPEGELYGLAGQLRALAEEVESGAILAGVEGADDDDQQPAEAAE